MPRHISEHTKVIKRLHSLASNRALAELKRRHPDEFKEIFQKIYNDIQVEQMLLGEVEADRTRGTLKHVAGEDGRCSACGKESPCAIERRRIRWNEPS